jgi:hypothetical protein
LKESGKKAGSGRKIVSKSKLIEEGLFSEGVLI